MWTTIIATAVAAAVCMSLISLATELKKDGIIDPPVVEFRAVGPKTS